MKPLVWRIALIIAVLLVIGQGTARAAEYVVNGTFETGDFSGWDEDGLCVINDGTLGLPEPIDGSYDAWVIVSGNDVSLLWRYQTLPSGIASATLSWSDRIFNDLPFYTDGQEVRVLLYDYNTGALYDVFLTTSGDSTCQAGPNHRSFIVTSLLQSLEGHDVSVVFYVAGCYADLFFALDNVSLDIVTAVEVDLEVDIDIKPGSDDNSINLGSNGKVPVAILGTADFDATTVDPYSVTLSGAEVVLKGKAQTPMASVEDVNGDGCADLVVHVDTQALELSDADTITVLEGETDDGRSIVGEGMIRIVP